MIIKICGITNLSDAQLAVELGANAIGFVMYSGSPRNISPIKAQEIIERLPSHILSVGVFVKNHTEHLNDGSWKAIQLHGLKSPEEIPHTDKRTFVAVSTGEMHRFVDHEIVIDESWGRGKTSNWQELVASEQNFILSGGLSPENVGEALRVLEPVGIDVSSGVESSPGKKDPEKLKKFLGIVNKFAYRKKIS